jgi:hypothetical protein
MAQMALWLEHAPLRVVADAYFAKAPFLSWMLSLGIPVITRMRWDAVGWDDPPPAPSGPPGKKKRGRPRTTPQKGKAWKIATLLHAFPVDTIQVSLYGQMRTLSLVTRDLWIRGLDTQKVRVVVIRTPRRPYILLSTELTLKPVQIITLYALRFSLEIGIREVKQQGGMGDYQCTRLIAMLRFVNLQLISYSLWRLALLNDLKAPWLAQEPAMTSPLSLTRASRALRRFVLERAFQKFAPGADFQKSNDLSQVLTGLIV